MFPRLNPEDPLARKNFWFEDAISFILYIWLSKYTLLAWLGPSEGKIASSSFGLFVILQIVSLFIVSHNFYTINACRRKHEELLSKYGEDYTNLLRETMVRDRFRGYLDGHWKHFEEEMVRRDKLKQARSVKE